MPYEYLEDIAPSDAAFKASGKTLDELFTSCAQAVLNVMVLDLNSIKGMLKQTIDLEDKDLEMLLYRFLEEIIYYKDARSLLLKPQAVYFKEENELFSLEAKMFGDRIDAKQHPLGTDVKAVTLYCLKIAQTVEGWEALVVLDI